MDLNLNASPEQRELFTFKRYDEKCIISDPNTEGLRPTAVLWQNGQSTFINLKANYVFNTHDEAFDLLEGFHYPKAVRYAKFWVWQGRALHIEAEIKPIKNTNHHHCGFYKIGLDSQYNLLNDHPKNAEYLPKSTAIEIIKELGFIEIPDDFDYYDLNSIEANKHLFSEEFIKAFYDGIED